MSRSEVPPAGARPQAQFVARVQGGALRVYRVGNELALLSAWPDERCERVQFRHETFIAGAAAVLVGHLLDEMRRSRRGVYAGRSPRAAARSLGARDHDHLQQASVSLWQALARADLIESIIDSAAGQADYASRRVALHTPHGRDNAPYLVADDGRNLQLLAAAPVRRALLHLLFRPEASDLGAQRVRHERRGPPERERWQEFQRTHPALAQLVLDRYGAPFFGAGRRRAREG